MNPGRRAGKFWFSPSHVAGIGAFPGAGFDEVHIAQVGGATEGFFEFRLNRYCRGCATADAGTDDAGRRDGARKHQARATA